jgi:predicted secreted protein
MWYRLDPSQRRGVVAGALACAVLLVVGILTFGGDGSPADRLVASGPPTTRRGATTSLGPAGRATSPLPSSALGGPTTTGPGGAASSSTTAAGQAESGGAAGGAAGGTTGGAAGGGGAGGVGLAGARNDGVTGGAEGTGVAPRGAGFGAPSDDSGSTSTTVAPDTSGDEPPPTTTSTTVLAVPALTLTQADNGRSVVLSKGEQLVVKLEPPAGGSWANPTTSAGSVLSRTSTDNSNGTVTATFTAVGPGTADVTAQGTPEGTSFKVTVEVLG